MSSFEEEGRPENSVSLSDIGRENDSHTYLSLYPSSSRSELLPASTSAFTRATEAYLHARESCRTQHLPERSHRHSRMQSHRSRHNHGKKFSRSTSVIQSEELKLLYLKVKIGFLIICLINVLVVVFCVLTNPKFNVFPDDYADFLDTGDGQHKTFKLCTKCTTVKINDGLLQDIRSSKYPDFCCFKRVDQLLNLVDWYSKTYTTQEIGKSRAKYHTNATKTSAKPQPVAAQLHFSESEHKCCPNGKLTWGTRGVRFQLSKIKVYRYTDIVIQQSGFYYMYSRMVFKKNGSVSSYKHTIIESPNPMNENVILKDHGTATNWTSSQLQGIYKLEKGSILSVKVSYETLIKEEKLNYFGIYKL